jgi:pSer/pThr/pTyr-binding forkhead associated (FHA) protein
MSEYFKKVPSDTVTNHSMPRQRRVLEVLDRVDAEIELPKTLRLTLPSGTVLDVSTEREISIGRKTRPSDPVVTVDLHQHEGFQHGVSRFHAMIVAVKGVLNLRDLNSVNGTLLNGHKLSPITSYKIQNGDIITFGTLEIKVEFA